LAHFTNFGGGSFSGLAVKSAMNWNEFGDFLAVASDQNFFTLLGQFQELTELILCFKGSKTTQKASFDTARLHLAYTYAIR